MSKGVATPPITIRCHNCEKQIYLHGEQWRHVDSGSVLCMTGPDDTCAAGKEGLPDPVIARAEGLTK